MKPYPKIRNGITLIELLVVISIMMVLAAIVLPQLEFGSERHKTRESARIVATYLSAARNKAIETGRPCGVLFERSGEPIDTDGDGTTDTIPTSVQMVQVQVPPPYAGDVMNATMRIGPDTTFNGYRFFTLSGFVGSLQWDRVQYGDLIQFDYKGPWYQIVDQVEVSLGQEELTVTGPVSAGTVRVRLTPSYTGHVPWETITSQDLAFQIRRQPVSSAGTIVRSMTPPQRLIAGTAVDFTASGISNSFFFGTGSVAIIFDSNGSVQSISGFAGVTTPTEPVYLLVGQATQVPDGTDVSWYEDPNIEENDRQANWQNAQNRWVVINPSTGIAAVAENTVPTDPVTGSYWVPDGSLDDGINPPGTQNDLRIEVLAEAIPLVREIAREGLDGGDR